MPAQYRLRGNVKVWLAALLLVAGCASATPATPTSAPSIGATPASAATFAPSPSVAPSPTSAPTATAPATNSPKVSAPPSPEAWNILFFGDSWPSGEHCNGCEAFPSLYGTDLATTTGHGTDLLVRTDPETAQELLPHIQSGATIRSEIAAADIIVTAIGTNDLEPAFDAYATGTCGGADKLDCFRTTVTTLATTFDGILTEIEDLRAGQPTAIRVVSMSNEFVSEPELKDVLGDGFSAADGVTVTKMMADMYCQAAAAHHATCVPLGPVLNGPDLLTPAEINSQESMQAVADAIAATGVDELE